jgi:O-antigen/teichoic acid export membrane protein
MSGANFILNILLARYLSPAEYGAFAIVFSIFLFLSGFHNALILEPMCVLGPSQYRKGLPDYLRSLLLVNFELTGGLAFVTAMAALMIGNASLGRALWGLALSIPLTLLFWFLRRAYYLDFKPEESAKASLIYAVLLIVGAYGLQHYAKLNAFWAFAIMGTAGVAASTHGLRRMYLQVHCDAASTVRPRVTQVFREHWDYGKWIVALAVLSLMTNHLQTLIVGAYLGLEAAGVLRAISNLVMPAAQTITALSVLTLPILSEDFGRGNKPGLVEKGVLLTVVLTGLGCVYETVLMLFSGPLEKLLYGGKFATHVRLIPILGLIPIFSGLSAGYSLVLRAVQEPKMYLIAGLAAAPIGLFSPIICMYFWDLDGAAASMVITSAWGSAVTYLLYRAWLSKRVG